MDVNRKAHPDCRYSSNPFHECASDCLEKISQGRGNKNSKKQGTFSVLTLCLIRYSMSMLLLWWIFLSLSFFMYCFKD